MTLRHGELRVNAASLTALHEHRSVNSRSGSPGLVERPADRPPRHITNRARVHLGRRSHDPPGADLKLVRASLPWRGTAQEHVARVRHSYASAGLANAAGWLEVKVTSERLGHANMAIAIDTHSHVLPAADEATAHTLATSILGGS